MLRVMDTDKPTLHLVCEMWDIMIEKVKATIYMHEHRQLEERSTFYEVIYAILIDRWTKSSTPFHCIAHFLNPRYYSNEWLNEVPNCLAPHRDVEISEERNKCLRKYFPSNEERKMVFQEFASFSGALGAFGTSDSLQDRWNLEPKSWWLVHGSSTPLLQCLVLKLFGQPSSSSCCERNWSTYSFIHSLKRNKMNPQRAEDLVFAHTNLRLLSRSSPQYNEVLSKNWDIGGDFFDSFEGVGILKVANLSLDEPETEKIFFNNEEDMEK
ncbi:Ribonuclease H-like protein [Dioscorea alata]|uniref:Ribonuclease H-like protein n=1 Tax=Dioscorea alata TaxID=55571 RepID=A0ACB7TVY3_DIOAL|nr:Ribonuclease H-like protein [Dioscorea alata]